MPDEHAHDLDLGSLSASKYFPYALSCGSSPERRLITKSREAKHLDSQLAIEVLSPSPKESMLLLGAYLKLPLDCEAPLLME